MPNDLTNTSINAIEPKLVVQNDFSIVLRNKFIY